MWKIDVTSHSYSHKLSYRTTSVTPSVLSEDAAYFSVGLQLPQINVNNTREYGLSSRLLKHPGTRLQRDISDPRWEFHTFYPRYHYLTMLVLRQGYNILT
jgi:hypothetical protein